MASVVMASVNDEAATAQLGNRAAPRCTLDDIRAIF